MEAGACGGKIRKIGILRYISSTFTGVREKRDIVSITLFKKRVMKCWINLSPALFIENL